MFDLNHTHLCFHSDVKSVCVYECVCVCVCDVLANLEVQAEVCRHVHAEHEYVCVACVCLCHCVSRVINTAAGAVTRAEKVRKFPQLDVAQERVQARARPAWADQPLLLTAPPEPVPHRVQAAHPAHKCPCTHTPEACTSHCTGKAVHKSFLKAVITGGEMGRFWPVEPV